MKIKLTKVTVQDKDKNGKPYISKDGKPYTRMGIQCQEYGEKWLSGFLGKANDSWKEGDTVDVAIDDVFKDGKNYLNFRPLTKFDLFEARILKLEETVKKLQSSGMTVNNLLTNEDANYDTINAELAGYQG